MTATYIEAISRGMWEEMERDKSVFLLGEDIGAYGGAFKATRGFLEHFGEERVIDTPLSEAAIVGAAIGAAVVGMRPIAEMQFADFVTGAFNQLVVNAAKIHYRWHHAGPDGRPVAERRQYSWRAVSFGQSRGMVLPCPRPEDRCSVNGI